MIYLRFIKIIRNIFFLMLLTSSFKVNAQHENYPKPYIGVGGHISYNGRFGLVDLVAERKIVKFKRASISTHIGTGAMFSFDGYHRISYLGMAGFSYAYPIKKKREIECHVNISTSNEIRLEPGMQFCYTITSKNGFFKTRFMCRLNIAEDFDYVSPVNPLIERDKNRPYKIYMGIGIRISKSLNFFDR